MKKHKRSILYVARSPQAYPASGGRTRIISVAKLHQEFGYHTTILCFVPLRFFLNRPRYLYQARKRLSNESGSKVIYFPEVQSFGKLTLLKIQQWLSVRALRCFYSRQFDILHGHGIGAAWLCVKTRNKKRNNLKVVADVHGASAEETMYSQNLSAEHPMIKRLHAKESELYQQADLCVFVSNQMVQHIHHKFGCPPSKYVIIPCATELPPEEVSRNQMRKSLGLQNKLAFVYLGSFRKYQMAKETIQLFKQISKYIEDTFLVIFTSHTQEFEKELQQLRIGQDKYMIKTLERKEVPMYLEAMDIGFMMREDAVLNRVASPTKFAEYLLSGLPVITTPYVGDYSQIVVENNLGFSLENMEVDDELITFIRNVKDHRMNFIDKCKVFAYRNLTWNGIAEHYKESLESLFP